MYMASVDTVSLSEYWTHVLADHLQTVSAVLTFIVAMILYPDVQRKAQAEIDQIVGNSRLPDFSDEGALPYVQAVLKEVLRWHPVTPLGLFYKCRWQSLVTDYVTGVPHRVTESDVYDGYYIPAGSTIIPNAWCVVRERPSAHQPQ
jgi:hypothetical protein